MGKTDLNALAASGDYLFHGSGARIEGALEPRQAHNYHKDGTKIKDDRPGIHATDIIDVAIFMALISRENFPEGYFSGFDVRDTACRFRVSRETFDQLNQTLRGYVYVFDKAPFAKRKDGEWICYDPISPRQMIEVSYEDLPESITIE